MAKKNNSNKINGLNQKAINSLEDYKELLGQIRDLEKEIAQINELNLQFEKEILETEHKLKTATGEERKELEKMLITLRQSKKGLEGNLDELESMLLVTKKIRENTSAIGAGWVTAGKHIKQAAVSAKEIGKDALKLNGVFGDVMNWQKEINKAGKAMAFTGKQAEAFSTNIQMAAGYTNQLGVDAGKLAKMQSSYSEQIGRSVQLSQEGLAAMAEMSEGTMLGAEGASEMAAAMDQFGISAVGARDRVNEMMKSAQKMGVNSVKVTKNLLTNMRLANKVHFKGGVKSMIRLAGEAANMRINLEGVANAAQKAFRPEDAVEMANKLSVLGGEFAKLGDPFTLMNKARHDFPAFTRDIANASKEFARFNSESGEFEISGLQLDRMKEIADALGMSADDLAEMGKRAAMIEKIEMETTLVGEDSAFVATIAKFNEATKEYEVTVNGQTKSINKLTDTQVKALRKTDADLKERAKTAQTFDETWDNLKNTFKTLLLPVMKGLSDALKGPMQKFMKEFSSKGGGFDKLFDWGKRLGEGIIKFGEFVKPLTDGLISFINDNPLTSIIGGLGLFTATKWFANGMALRAGFNSVGGGLMDMLNIGGKATKSGRRMSMGAKGMKGIGNMFGGKDTMVGKMFRDRAAKSAMKSGGKGMMKATGKGLMKGIGKSLLKKIPIIGALAGLGFGIDRMMDGDMTGGLMEIGSGLLSTIPGIGTAASIGMDAAIAGRDVYNSSKMDQYDDVIMRSGQAPIAINPADDIMSVKKDGPVDKALGNANTGSGSVNMSFSPIKIEGKLELVGDGFNGELALEDPILMRDLSRIVQEEIRKAIGGGKLNPNPV